MNWTEYLTTDFIFGFAGGIVVTAFLALFFCQFMAARLKRELARWEKLVCAFFSGLLVAMAWGKYSGGINWNQIPALVIVYGSASGFVYENIIKPLIKKGDE